MSAELSSLQKTSAPQSVDQLITLLAKAARQTPTDLYRTLSEQLVTRLWQSKELPLAPELSPALANLIPLATSWLTSAPNLFSEVDHPLRGALQTLTSHLSHWCPRDSKPSQQFIERLHNMIGEAQSAPANQQPLFDFNLWADKEAARAAMLAQRIEANEVGESRFIEIEAQVIEALNDHLGHRPFPTELHSGLIASLKNELQFSLVGAGDNPDAAQTWKYWLRLLPLLGQVFSSDDEAVDDKILYSQIPPLVSELERSLQLPLSHPETYSAWIDELCRDLMCAIQKKDIATSRLPLLQLPDGYSANDTRVTQTLLKQSQAIETGSWLCFQQSDELIVRCQLAIKNIENDQFLLVDQAGRKVFSKTTKDMALCLSTGVAYPLKTPELNSLVEQLINNLRQQAIKLQQQLNAKAQARAQEEQAQKRAQDEAAERAMQIQLEQRRAAAHKAMAEARQLAEEKTRRQAEEKQLQAQRQQEQLAQQEMQKIQAQDTINELKVGAWIELNTAEQPSARCKLSVIIGSTSKYIFVDQVGRKQAEFIKQELVELVLKDQLKVLRQGDNFEDQLAKVIRGLRKDIT